MLRLLIGEIEGRSSTAFGEQSWLLETNVDDMNPEWLGALIQVLFDDGALDMWFTPIQAKKGRPGTLLSVLAQPKDVFSLRERIFAETTTLGIRESTVTRWSLPRRVEIVKTSFGKIRVKLAEYAPSQWKAAPEYEDCYKAAAFFRSALARGLSGSHGSNKS